ncbi:hypothetical protein DPMN_146733 [Dreissena polymorpha]|uniref:Uncharacterized protein n=1 Tax=Dreissena polymorpha TaxID=45954 RepID=A0A9D4F7L6_DREPO|nr:hypothetical protein DPMN_146733 [Dreissena polymorpha]
MDTDCGFIRSLFNIIPNVVEEFLGAAIGPPEGIRPSIAVSGHEGGRTVVITCVVMAHADTAI